LVSRDRRSGGADRRVSRKDTTMTNDDMIEVKIVREEYRYARCDVCGGVMKGGDVLAVAEGAGPSGQDIYVCESCLAEPDRIDERLAERAAEAEQRLPDVEEAVRRGVMKAEQNARFLRSAVGRLKVPTYEQFEEAQRAVYLESFQYELADAAERGNLERLERIREDWRCICHSRGGQLPEAFERAFVAAREKVEAANPLPVDANQTYQ
jgi:hypothetical protein